MMKRILSFILLFGLGFWTIEAQIKFDNYFKRNTLRVDFSLAGDYQTIDAYLKQLLVEPYWGGRKTNLETFHGRGNYKVTLRDNLTNNIIYTEGFSTLFEEWQTSGEAKRVKKNFYATVLMPLPFRKATITIMRRVGEEFTDTLLIVPFDPESPSLRRATYPMYRQRSIRMTGSPEHSLDIVVIGDGYLKEEVEDFFDDAKKFMADLFSSEVYRRNMNRINIRAISAVSYQSGCDNPLQDIWAQTVMNTSFYTIGLDRYLMTEDIKAVRDIAGMVPYDQIYVLVNTDVYGGGGIFNCINVSSADSHSSQKLIPHELGHGFAGLADEYTNSGMHYIDMVDLSTEPWEVNLTTHVTDSIKWESYIKKNTPIPTPPNMNYGHKTVGLFEGGGNIEKGVWRPAYDCRMRTNNALDFCPVCEDAIEWMINFYTGGNDSSRNNQQALRNVNAAPRK